MLHIRLFLWGDAPDGSKVSWSRSEFAQMIQAVQKSGATELWSFELRVDLVDRHEGCQAMRIGWLDVPWQPEFRGEWRLEPLGASPETSGTAVPALSA